MKRFCIVVMAAALLMMFASPAVSEVKSHNPLLNPQPVRTVRTQDDFLNILLLGIEKGFDGYDQSASSRKGSLTENHTDVLMVLSINKTQGKINLISIPRDTLTYVPEVHGIYKLNAAFNCASTARQGLRRSRDAVSWLLGGVKIDAYCALDMAALVTLTDLMGGVDFDMDMDYYGGTGVHYRVGRQHLDGLGILDYVRARQNATVDATDLGRTNRGRKMITAIIQKLWDEPELVNTLWAASQKSSVNFYTDLNNLNDFMSLWDTVHNADNMTIGSYALEGNYVTAMSEWNFTFTNQQNRLQVIREVFGVEAQEIPYVSKRYTDWLMETGLTTVHAIRLAEEVMDFALDARNPSDAQRQAIAQLEAGRDAAVAAFDRAADEFGTPALDNEMVACRRELMQLTEQTAAQFGYEGTIKWGVVPYTWFQDPLINEYHDIEWR